MIWFSRHFRFVALAAFVPVAGAAVAGFDSEQWLKARSVLDAQAAALAEVYSNQCSRIDVPAAELSIPVEAFPSGATKTILSAKHSQILDSGSYIWGDGVCVRQFNEQGATQLVVTAENCLVGRSSRNCWVAGEATAEGRGHYLVGQRVFIDFKSTTMRIYKGAWLRATGLKLGEDNDGTMTLTSEAATYDRERGVALFERGVHLEDGKRALECDRAWVFLEGTNELKRVVALGSVTFDDGGRKAGAPRAQYLRSESRLELLSDGDDRAWLEECGGNRWRLEGAKLVYHVDTEQVEVDDVSIVAESTDFGSEVRKGFNR